jgi:YbbR domain-containing protein
MQNLQEDKLVIELDMGRLEAGRNEFTVAPDNLQLPGRIELNRVDPHPVVIRTARTQQARIPIRVETTGSLPDSLALSSAEADPGSVPLRFPGEGSAPEFVSTEPIDLSKIEESGVVETRLVLPAESRLPNDEEGRVSVQIKLTASERKDQ